MQNKNVCKQRKAEKKMKDDDEYQNREEHLDLLIPLFLSAFRSYSTVLTSDDRMLFLVSCLSSVPALLAIKACGWVIPELEVL